MSIDDESTPSRTPTQQMPVAVSEALASADADHFTVDGRRVYCDDEFCYVAEEPGPGHGGPRVVFSLSTLSLDVARAEIIIMVLGAFVADAKAGRLGTSPPPEPPP